MAKGDAKDQRKGDAARLKRLFESHQARLDPTEKITQDEFGERYGIGSQGMVWQYLNFTTPLNLSAAVKFARGLGCKIEDFSPSIATEVLESLPYLTHKLVVAHDNSDAQLLSYFQALESDENRDRLMGMAQRLFREEHPDPALRLTTDEPRKPRKRA